MVERLSEMVGNVANVVLVSSGGDNFQNVPLPQGERSNEGIEGIDINAQRHTTDWQEKALVCA